MVSSSYGTGNGPDYGGVSSYGTTGQSPGAVGLFVPQLDSANSLCYNWTVLELDTAVP